MAAQLGQAATKFRLKNHNECDGKKHRKAADDPADYDEIQQGRDQGQCQKNDSQPGQYLRAAGAPKIKVSIIDHDAEQDDLESAAPTFQPKVEKLLNHLSFRELPRSRAAQQRFLSRHAPEECSRPASAATT